MPWIFKWMSSLDIPKFVAAYHRIIQKHESLRTTFDIDESAHLRQFVKPFNADLFQVEIVDFEKNKLTNTNVVSSTVNTFISLLFDLQKLSLIRLQILKHSDNEYTFVFSLHHIIADGRSIQILQNDLLRFYQQELDGVIDSNNNYTANLTYKDYSEWHVPYGNTKEGIKSRQYWLDILKHPIPVFEVLGSKPRPAQQTFRSGHRTIHFSLEDLGRLQEITLQGKGTLYISLFTLVTIALNEFIDGDEMMIGCPVDGRSSPELEDIVGYFVNVLPIRVKLDGNNSFQQHYKNVREQVFGALQHQNYALDEIIDLLEIKRDRSRNPLFDVVLTMDVQEGDIAENNLSQQISTYDKSLDFNDSKFDFTFGFNTSEKGIGFTLKYNTDIYDDIIIDTIINHVEKLLLGKIHYHNCKISDIEWIASEEKKALLKENSNSINNFNIGATVVSVFESQVLKSPDAIALVFEKNNWTYRQLNEKANAFACYLIEEKGVKKGDFIGIELERSDYLLVAILAVIKTGAAYVPINPDYPVYRKQFIYKDANLKIVLNSNELESFIFWSDSNQTLYQNPILGLTPEDIAYIMYTSGSTGQPKGVLVEHRNIIRLICNPNYTELTAQDKLLQTGAIEFDASTFEIWGMLANGGQLHVLQRDLVKDPSSIKNYINEKGITSMWFTASYFDSIVLEDVSLFAGLKKIIVGGSSLSPLLIKKVKDQFPDLSIVNGYGPSENTTFSLAYQINQVEDNIPIGKPVNGTTAYVFNKYDKLLPVGLIGEILLGGTGLARGYLNRPELTKEKFITNPYNPSERLYRTGDLGRWREDGNLEYLGRMDDQVKIRGYRIELGELEQALSSHNKSGQAVVIARAINNTTDKVLIAYTTGEAAAEELKTYLKELLPSYMVPDYYVKLESIPLTSNGKVDRKALPDPDGTGIQQAAYIAPNSETEKKLVKIWSEVLGVDEVTLSIKADFFDLGGHSIKAIRLLGQTHKHLGVKLALKELFANSTIEQLSKLISTSTEKEAYASIPTIKASDNYAVSSSQRRLWVLSRFDGANEAYNIPQVVRLEGSLNEEAFITSYQKLLTRHEVLRTIFTEDAEGNPRQRVLPIGDERFNVIIKDFSEVTESDRSKVAERTPAGRAGSRSEEYVVEEVCRGFSLEEGPLIRCSLLKETDSSYVWVLVMHHIVSDGWSMGVLHIEWSELYNAELEQRAANLPPLSIQYKDYSAWHNAQLQSEEINIHKNYWLEQFKGELPVLELPSDKPRPKVMTYNGASIFRELDKQTTDSLKAFSQQQGGTMFMTLQTALNILLNKYTGQEDIVIGSPIAGREHPDLEGQFGFYVNTLALRNQFSKEDTVTELYQKIKQNTLGAYSHQVYPYDELVDTLELTRDMSRNPLFDVMLIYQSTEEGETELNFSQANILPYLTEESNYEVAKFDMSFGFEEHSEGLYYSLNYNSDIYSEEQVKRMLNHLEQLLETITTQTQTKITAYEILTKEEKAYLLETLNDTKADYPSDKTIVDLFEEQVKLNPENIAIKFQETELTYRELNEQSNQLAHYLIKNYTIQPDDLVGIELERSEWMVIGILAIIKSGGAYVPIDPEYPEQRKDFIKEDASFKVTLNQQELEKFRAAINNNNNEYPRTNPNIELSPNHLMYVIYTSGSTGNPKGCMLEHRGLVNRLNWMQKSYSLTGKDCVLQKTTFTFDVSVWELIWWSLQGASVSILEPGREGQPEKIISSIASSGVTVIHFVPSMLSVFLEYLSQNLSELQRLSSLKQVYCSGEALSADQVRRFKGLLPGLNLMNLYGPTEASIDVSYYACSDEDAESIPIGRPIDNSMLYVLESATQRMVPYGSVGEICIGGVGLARGYVNRPDLTREKFIDNPYRKGDRLYRTGDLGRWREDGNLEYVGRMDDQVKIRGYRIELGEIEHVLSGYPASGQAIVIARLLNAMPDKELIAYTTGEASAEDLRAYLKERLPHYMVPAYYVKLDKIPLTGSGKADRKSLPNPQSTGLATGAYVPPGTETEKQLVKIWSEVLGLQESTISITADFFALGGNSLLAVRLITRIYSLLKISLLISDLFLNSELDHLGKMIDGLKGNVKSNFEIEL